MRKLLKLEGHTPKLKRKIRLGWAISIVNAMVIEIIAIIASKFILLAYRPHIFAFNLGYQRRAAPSVSHVVSQIMLEIAIEVTIDFTALRKEMKKCDIPVDVFFGLITKESFITQFFGSCVACVLAFLTLRTTPSTIFCSSPVDPCSCIGGVSRCFCFLRLFFWSLSF